MNIYGCGSRMNAFVLATLLLDALLFFKTTHANCSVADYEKCRRIADPLVKQVHLIFPDNMEDIDMVCATWNNFVDCLHSYTGKCFTDGQRREFKKLIEKPLESVHKMCTQVVYQKEYLTYASCLKSVVIEGGRCGPYYGLMLMELERNALAGECCSHGRFKQCVLSETERVCDHGVRNGPAYRLCTDIISNAFSATEKNCENYIPNSGDCPLPTESVQITSAPSESYPWSTTVRGKSPKGISTPETLPAKPITTWLPPSQEPSSKPITTWLPSSKELPSKPITTWLPPSRELPSKPLTTWQPTPELTDPVNVTADNAHLTSRVSPSRPASYGKASSWGDVQVTQPLESSGTIATSVDGEKSTSPVENWKDVPSTWYPAAGSQLSNEVDEPNQLGLVKHEGSKAASFSDVGVGLILLIIVSLWQF